MALPRPDPQRAAVNMMDFNGSPAITAHISDYKQVGAFCFQTDGP